MLVFDPYKPGTEMSDATEIQHYKQLAVMALKLVQDNAERRRQAGRADIYSCPVVHRKSGEVRFLNFAPNYQGRLDHAECCFKGAWRIATFQEEDAEHEKMRQARLAASREALKLS